VLVVTTWLPTREKPEVGTFVARDVESLSRDHEVHVLHLSAAGTTLPLGGREVSLTTVPMSPANPLSVWRASRAVADRIRTVDVVHTMAVSALLPFTMLRVNRPWVHTEHWSAMLAPKTTGLVPRLAIPVMAMLLRRPDLVVAVGRRLAAAIRIHRMKPTVVIPNAVQRPPWLAPRPGGPRTTLVAVGGLIARKGPDVAVETVAELGRRGVTARLIWAGDGPMRDAVAMLAERLGVADLVELRGRVAPEAIGDLLAEGDVFLLPTTMETFGVAIAEALAAGRPVVVGAQGEQESFVAEPDGVLVREQTGAAFADAVERVLALNAYRPVDEIAGRAHALFDEGSRRSAYAEAYARAADAHTSTEASSGDVDVVIAVHDPRRRIDRAVESVLTSRAVARVIVVCHGTPASGVVSAARTSDPRVEFVEFEDGIRSPAGPFNHGLGLATGRFVAIMGSDDELTAGAVDLWRDTARSTQADVIMAPLRHAGGAPIPTPPTLRRRGLRGGRDRLAYRTAPLGLLAREAIEGLHMTPQLATCEDLAFTARLWFGPSSVSLHRDRGEYLIHDGDDRVTFTRRALADELRAVQLLIRNPWFRGLSSPDRVALAAKLWRITVFGAVHYRAGAWGEGDRAWLSGLAAELEDFAPGTVARLSRADADLIQALADPAASDSEVDRRSRRRRRFASAAALLPSHLTMLLAREAPLRFFAATWLAGRR